MDGSFHGGANSAGRRISLLCIAECASVSGRGYYATEPALDVLRRPDRREGVLARPTDRGKCEATLRAPLLECEMQATWLKQGCNSMNSPSRLNRHPVGTHRKRRWIHLLIKRHAIAIVVETFPGR